jgi:hypothetical protein
MNNIATLAEYGPNNKFCSKIVVSILDRHSNEIVEIRKWHSDGQDLRSDALIVDEIKKFLSKYNPNKAITMGKIIGCPHEEGVDYPESGKCPECKYWMNRDRFTNEIYPVN